MRSLPNVPLSLVLAVHDAKSATTNRVVIDEVEADLAVVRDAQREV